MNKLIFQQFTLYRRRKQRISIQAFFLLKASKKLRFVILLKSIVMLSGTASVEQRDLLIKNLQFLSLANVRPKSQSCKKIL